RGSREQRAAARSRRARRTSLSQDAARLPQADARSAPQLDLLDRARAASGRAPNAAAARRGDRREGCDDRLLCAARAIRAVWPAPEPRRDGRRMPVPRGKVIGGSGSINGMFAMRGHPKDYDQWAQMGASGWSFADVLPYFKKSEDSWRGEGPYHGSGGPVAVRPIDSPHLLHVEMMAAAAAAGFSVSEDLAGDCPEGFARGEQTVDKRGRRVSAATAYLKPAMGRQNLDVRSGVLVRKLVFEGKRCVGVEVETGGEPKVVRTRREVIVSGGTYNSPHLLLL